MGANFREKSLATTGAMLFVPQGTRQTGSPQIRQRSVLICAPSRGLCRTIAQIVNGLGVQAVAATDGGAALRLGGRHDPDLVIIRENMPGMLATDFIDAGLERLLARRILIVERRTAGQRRRLPTIEFPTDAERLADQLQGWLH